jgi:hypothetical protein
MTTKTSVRRVLRIGILLGGAIVEERLIRDHGPVSVGQSARNTFSVALEHLPRTWTLFTSDRDGVHLHIGAGMEARVSDGARVQAVTAGQGPVRLGEHARGKLSLGDLTILFQLVAEPPIQPRPLLPAAVRGRLADRIDPRLAVIQSVSVVACLAVAIAAWLHDPPAHRDPWGAHTAAIQGDTVDEMVIDPDTLMPPPVDPATDTPAPPPPAVGTPSTPLPVEPPHGPTGPITKRAPHADGPIDLDALQEQAKRYAATLAGDDPGEDGVNGKMQKTAPGSELKTEIDQTRKSNQDVEIGGGSDRTLHGNVDPRAGTVTKGPPVNVDGPKHVITKVETEPKPRVVIGTPKPLDTTSLNAAAVLARITGVYSRGLQRCYSRLLAEQPGARGKVGLSFTVNEAGRVTDPSAKADDASLSTCIEGQMRAWTFAVPEDEDHEATSAAFAVTLALQPE